MARAWVGTSGYDYDSWKGPFYPEDLPRGGRLRFYASRFDALEVNNTFYNLPSKETLDSWNEAVSGNPRFRFVLKAHRYLTQRKKLKEPRRGPIRDMLAVADGLGGRCVGLLWQFPGNWHADVGRLRAFLDDLEDVQRGDWWHAFEFRDRTWFGDDVVELLRERGMALVVSDMPFDVVVPGETRPRRGFDRPVVRAPLTSDVVYLRRHGTKDGYDGGYSRSMLDTDARHVERWTEGRREVYAFFNNDVGAHAPHDAGALARRVGG